MDVQTSTQPKGKRRITGDSLGHRGNKRRTPFIPLDQTFVFKGNNDGDGGDDNYDTESTIASDYVVKENVPPPTRAGTVDAEDRSLCDFDPALVEMTPKPTIKKARVRESNKLSFVVGFGSPVWVSYGQVRGSRRIRTFMKALKPSQWKEFIAGREGRRLQPASLDYSPYGGQMEVKEVLHMKKWDGQWMFEIRATDLVLDDEGVYGMGIVDDAAEFLHANGGDADVVD
ncbi:hypothetical protein F5Y03DRAFT_160641 [Xylaria venustula]|nr:hypothetical protein F5Y03DRAFT_160641 [Xylaria venustula]